MSNFIVTAPLFTATSPEICKAMQDNLISVFSTPVNLICDQDPAFMSHLTQTMLQSYGTNYAFPNLVDISPFELVTISRTMPHKNRIVMFFKIFLNPLK